MSIHTRDYLNFDLLITRAGNGYRAYVIDAPGGDADITFKMPFAPDELARLVHREGTQRGLRLADVDVPPSRTLQDLGSQLYDTIFRDTVHSVLVASQMIAQSEERNLRIRLRFSEDAAELAILPWEILFDTEQQHFLALSELRPILRYLSLPRSRPPLMVEPPLSILAVLASPSDHTPLDVDAEWQAVERALTDLQEDGKVTLERLDPPTFEALRIRLMGEPAHVLHFVGHGIYNEAKMQGQLLFEDSYNKGHLVPALSLAQLLHNHASMRLVYLNACEGAIADQNNVFAGVAQTLVLGGIPAAVAMQDEISDFAAIEMARIFYTELATGRPIDAALTHARVALSVLENDEWIIPILFSRSRDNRLFDVVDVLPTPKCPYPGMRPFTTEQADKFFGRDQESDDAISRLAQYPFLAVVGPSGSGKSSLVYAGIIPALQRSDRFGDGKWTIKTMRPSDSRTATGDAAPMIALAQLLPTLIDANSETLNQVTLDTKTLLFIDQCEEVFTLADDEAKRFLQTLDSLIGTLDLYIVLTVRADFYPEMMASGAIWKSIKANRLELTPLGDDELWAAIVEPAAIVGVTVDNALAVALIADAAGEAGVLPLVQEALVMLWEKVEKRELRLDAYQSMADGRRNGVQVAIDRRANVVYNNLPEEAKSIARRIFLRLIQFGQGRADTRRQQTVETLLSSSDDRDIFDETLLRLVDSRLLTSSGKENEQARRIDISHEALISGWGLLQKWIEEQRDAETTRRRLEEKVAEWIRLGKSGGLLDEYETQEAEIWLEGEYSKEIGYSQNLINLISDSNAAIIGAEAEKVAAERSRLRSRLFGIGLILAIITASLVGWFWMDALKAKDLATIARNETERLNRNIRAAQLSSDGLRIVESAPQQALLLTKAGIQQQIAKNEPISKLAQGNLRALVSQVGGTPLIVESAISTAQFSPSGEWIAIAHGSMVELRSIEAPTQTVHVLSTHSEGIGDIAFAQDMNLLASVDGVGQVRLWNWAEDIERSLCKHSAGLVELTFTANYRWLISLDRDGKLCANQIDSPLTKPLEWQISSSFFSAKLVPFPEGAQFAISYFNTELSEQVVEIWDLDAPDQPQRRLQADWEFDPLAVSPDVRWLIGATSDGWGTQLWDLAQPDAQTPIILDEEIDYPLSLNLNECDYSVGGSTHAVLPAKSNLVSFSPDSRWIVFGDESTSGGVRFWYLEESSPVPFLLCGHQGSITEVLFSPNGELFATAGADAQIRVWNINNFIGGPRYILRGHDDHITSLDFDLTGRWLVSGSGDGSVRLWDLLQPQAAATTNALHGAAFYALEYSADGRWLASSGSTGDVDLWNVDTLSTPPVAIAASPASKLAFAHHSNRLAVGERDGSLTVWDVENPQQPKILFNLAEASGGAAEITVLSFSSDDQLLASASDDVMRTEETKVIVWDLQNTPPASQTLTFPADYPNYKVNALSFAENDRVLFAATKDGEFNGETFDYELLRWELNNANHPPQIKHLFDDPVSGIKAVAFSRDAQWLLSSTYMGSILSRLDQSPNDISIQRVLDAQAQVAVFSNGGDWLAMATDNEVRLLSLADGADEEPILIMNHRANSSVNALTFSPDDRYIASAGDDATIRLAPVDFDEVLDMACRTAGRNLRIELTDDNNGDRQPIYEGAEYGLTGSYQPLCPNEPFSSETIEAITMEAKELAQNSDLSAATERLEQLISWLSKSGQFDAYGIELAEWLAALQMGEDPWGGE